jgi:hypothetical protein
MQKLKVGDKVKWARPASPGERNHRFTVLEVDNLGRCLIQAVLSQTIPLESLAWVDDLVLEKK